MQVDIAQLNFLIQPLKNFLREQKDLGIDCAFKLENITYSWFKEFIEGLNPDQKNKIEEFARTNERIMVPPTIGFDRCSVSIYYNPEKPCCVQFSGSIVRLNTTYH